MQTEKNHQWRVESRRAVQQVVDSTTAAIRVAEQNVGRAQRAVSLIEAGAVQETSLPGVYTVRSGQKHYPVDVNAGTCPCEDAFYRFGWCKHLLASLAYQQVVWQADVRAAAAQPELLAA